jgi:hypothetical protein
MSGLPSWARVGAKVICILSDWTPDERAAYRDVSFPVEGATYTIREVTTTYWDGVVCLRLEEICNPVIMWRDGAAEAAFDVGRFRPLHTLETDLEAHFTELLTIRNPQTEDA